MREPRRSMSRTYFLSKTLLQVHLRPLLASWFPRSVAPAQSVPQALQEAQQEECPPGQYRVLAAGPHHVVLPRRRVWGRPHRNLSHDELARRMSSIRSEPVERTKTATASIERLLPVSPPPSLGHPPQAENDGRTFHPHPFRAARRLPRSAGPRLPTVVVPSRAETGMIGASSSLGKS